MASAEFLMFDESSVSVPFGWIPAGMRVIHRDGDSLNDSLGNFALGTAGDAIRIWIHHHAAQHRQHLESVAWPASSQANTDRGRVRAAKAAKRSEYEG